MIETLQPLLTLSTEVIWIGLLAFIRIGAVVFALPAFGEQAIPLRVKLGMAFAFTLAVAPAASAELAAIPASFGGFLAALVPEVVTGLFFGLLLRFFIFALQIAGTIAAQSTSLSQIFGGTAGVDPQPAMGHVLVTAGLALAALMDLHVHFVRYIIASYELVPAGQMISPGDIADLGVSRVGATFALGFSLAAPFAIASLIYNVTLGVINRAMPQLMVSFVGAPAITFGGLGLLFLCAPLMLSVWIEAFDDFVSVTPGLLP